MDIGDGLPVPDTLVLHGMEQIQRMGLDDQAQRDIANAKRIDVVLKDVPIVSGRIKRRGNLTRSLLAHLVEQVYTQVENMEREMNHQRTMDGMAAARSRGTRRGRRPIERPGNFDAVRARWEKKEISEREAARLLGVARATFKKWAQE